MAVEKILLDVEEMHILMTNHVKSPKFYTACAVAVLIILAGVSCAPAADVPVATPALQTVEVTRAITQVVTQEVTCLVEVPVPVTVTPTPDSRDLPDPFSHQYNYPHAHHHPYP